MHVGDSTATALHADAISHYLNISQLNLIGLGTQTRIDMKSILTLEGSPPLLDSQRNGIPCVLPKLLFSRSVVSDCL